jgi:hypothetical protein
VTVRSASWPNSSVQGDSRGFAEQLRVLRDAQGQPAKLVLATVDLAYSALPNAERAALKGALEAVAIPHWCDEAFLAVLLDIPKEESAAAPGDPRECLPPPAGSAQRVSPAPGSAELVPTSSCNAVSGSSLLPSQSEAEDLYQKALAIQMKLFAPEHVTIATIDSSTSAGTRWRPQGRRQAPRSLGIKPAGTALEWFYWNSCYLYY